MQKQDSSGTNSGVRDHKTNWWIYENNRKCKLNDKYRIDLLESPLNGDQKIKMHRNNSDISYHASFFALLNINILFNIFGLELHDMIFNCYTLIHIYNTFSLPYKHPYLRKYCSSNETSSLSLFKRGWITLTIINVVKSSH